MFRVEDVNSEKQGTTPSPRFIPKKVTLIEPLRLSEIISIPPRTCLTATPIANEIENLNAFSVREDDVWVVTMPKCGTTWAQEMCWLILNDLDYETARKLPLEERSPFFEFSTMVPQFYLNTTEFLKNMKSPRLIKTHLSLQVLPREVFTKKAKMVYVARDPRDAAISLYHHITGMIGIPCKLNEVLDDFLGGNSMPGPYWDHVLEFWRLREQSNVLFLTYEEMKEDLGPVIKKVCTFLNKQLTDDEIKKLVNHLSFENMKNNPSCSHEVEMKTNKKSNPGFKFMRRGQVGSYKDELPAEYHEKFKNWIHKNLEGTGCTLYL